MKDAGGNGFWHETYLMSGGIEAIYDDMPETGLARFAPLRPARGVRFSSRTRAGRDEKPVPTPVMSEADYYGPFDDESAGS